MRKLDYNMENINTVLISHAHKDHALAAQLMSTCGFDLVMPPETAVTLELEGSNIYTPESGKQILVNTLIVVPFELVHFNSDGSDCPCYGYLIASKATRERLLFATDTAYIKSRFEKPLDYILLEVNYMSSMIDGGETEDFVTEVEKRRLKSHMSLETAVEFLESIDRSRLKTLYAIHGSNKRLDKDEAYIVLEPYAERVIVP